MRHTPRFGDTIVLRPEEFRLLRDLFAARTGLHFGPEARFALERRLRERLMVLKLSSFAEYYQCLRFGAGAAQEWDEAIDLLTTNETYFFREDRQLRAFQNEILPMLSAQSASRRRLAIWSAGCATGEEAYTIAIIVHRSNLFPRCDAALPRGCTERGDGTRDGAEHRSPTRFNRSGYEPSANRAPSSNRMHVAAPCWDVRIYGTDLSRRCVAAARRGIYGESSFRVTPPELRRAFFQEKGGAWHVSETIRQLCHFGQTNLLDDGRTLALGKADVIFCRNVLIYFDATARKAAIEGLYACLNPGGVLLLGHSESLLNVSTAFELVHLKDDLVYRKPLSARDHGSTSDPFP